MDRLPVSTESRLVFRDIQHGSSLFGAMLAITGFLTLIGGKQSPWVSMALLGVSILVLLFPNVLTICADKSIGVLALEYRSVLMISLKEIPLNELHAVRLHSRGFRRPCFRIVVITKDGKETPLRPYYDHEWDQKQQMADQLIAFIDIGKDRLSAIRPECERSGG